MDRRTQEDPNRISAMSARYRVSQQEIQQWIEQGFAANDVEWAYRFAETSPKKDVQSLLTMRQQGMTWDDVRRHLEEMRRGERNPNEQASGKKLVPGGERRTSRYFYRDMARMLDQHSGPKQETGYPGTPAVQQHAEKQDSFKEQDSIRKSKDADDK